MPEFYDLWPHKFTNVTNGVTPRRWLASCNPGLSEVLDQYAGLDWITDMESLKLLEQWPGDKLLLSKIEETKLLGKHKRIKLCEPLNYLEIVSQIYLK